jgi:hypothetical protein
MATIEVAAGDDTEAFLRFVMSEISGDELDQIEVARTMHPAVGLASEPITVAVVFAAAPVMLGHVARLLERWLEQRRRLAALRIIADTALKSLDAGKVLAEVAKKQEQVTIEWGSPVALVRAEVGARPSNKSSTPRPE